MWSVMLVCSRALGGQGCSKIFAALRFAAWILELLERKPHQLRLWTTPTPLPATQQQKSEVEEPISRASQPEFVQVFRQPLL